jgi:hypothetical protein
MFPNVKSRERKLLQHWVGTLMPVPPDTGLNPDDG